MDPVRSETHDSSNASVGGVLNRLLQLRKRRNPSYSLRAFARDLGVSPTFLSAIFRDRRRLSLKTAKRFARTLGLSPFEANRLFESVFDDKLKGAEASAGEDTKWVQDKRHAARSASRYHSLSAEEFQGVASWICLAILELVGCESPPREAAGMARRLGVRDLECLDAIARLSELGLIETLPEGGWRKTRPHLYFDIQKTDPRVRAFHEQAIDRAKAELKKTSASDFAARQVVATTMTVDPSKISEAQRLIVKFQADLAKLMTDSPAKEVYQLTLQFIPLTNSSEGAR